MSFSNAFHFVNRKEAEIFLEMASEMELTGKEYVWMVAQSIVGDYKKQITPEPLSIPKGVFGKTLWDSRSSLYFASFSHKDIP